MTTSAVHHTQTVLERLGVRERNSGAAAAGRFLETHGSEITSTNPATGETIARVSQAAAADYEAAVQSAQLAFETWRLEPAPRRGEIVRELGNALRRHSEDLGRLVSLENGKILSEGLGEVQEMIDICDFAVGPVAPALRPHDAQRARPATACTSSGTRSGRSASSPPSTFRSPCGRGTRRSPRSAATRWSGSRRTRRRSPRSRCRRSASG